MYKVSLNWMENIPLSTFLALLLIGLSHYSLAVFSFKVGATGMATVAMAKHFLACYGH